LFDDVLMKGVYEFEILDGPNGAKQSWTLDLKVLCSLLVDLICFSFLNNTLTENVTITSILMITHRMEAVLFLLESHKTLELQL
jgi:hypothetical protein